MNDRSTVIAPVVAVGLAAVWMMLAMAASNDVNNGMHLDDFGRLPCQANGRVKPLDTVARNSLMIISGRQTFMDENDKEHPAIEWLADVFVSQPPFTSKTDKEVPKAMKDRVFRIDSEQLINMLGLEPRFGFHYSLEELLAKKEKFAELAKAASKKDPKNLDDADNKLRDLGNHAAIFQALADMKVPSMGEDEEKQDLGLFPPAERSENETWLPLLSGDSQQKLEQRLKFYKMLTYYKQGNVAEFNKALDEYKHSIEQERPSETRTADFEAFFNNFAPFYWCSLVYLVVIVMCIMSWLVWRKPLIAAAFWLSLFALVVHTLALLARMYIQGRPPVTNLYSSAVFIGWGCVGLCLALEYLYKNGLFNVGAGVLGAATLFVAHYLGSEGDTLEMLQAVLDTNFWLATHVVCVTFGYTATFVAGFLGVAFVVLGVFTPFLNKDWIKALGQATYGVLCFATLLSFTGTVLGGIWADQSWGRFWGWDPKENGAVLIVIWNALILHARWAGLVKERGIAVLTIFGNMVTAWSYFGTNQLGVGLHAYGFNKHLADGCAMFWIVMAFLILVGSLPRSYWWSFNAQKYAPKPFTRPSLKSVPS